MSQSMHERRQRGPEHPNVCDSDQTDVQFPGSQMQTHMIYELSIGSLRSLRGQLMMVVKAWKVA
jgi:hypothetical protein